MSRFKKEEKPTVVPISNPKQESVEWYFSHEKQIDNIFKLIEKGFSTREIETKLRIGESYIIQVLKNGKEIELNKIMKFAHLTKEDIEEYNKNKEKT